MTRGDAVVERGAQGLQRLARRAAESGGITSRLAPELADDAAFLRKLKPSLIAARVRGNAPTNGRPGETPAAPSGPQLGRGRRKGGGPSPWLVLGAAFALGIVLAKAVDWRGHAHPRD
jgi:hypothetical protein